MTSSTNIAVQVATRSRSVPTSNDLAGWARGVLDALGRSGSLTLRLVDRTEGERLNERYRRALGKSGPTNVLSFSYEPTNGLPAELDSDALGDVVLCAPVITAEAHAQAKTSSDHWAHLVVHGVLHLLGYDHDNRARAEQMEALERRLLRGYGVSDPYASRAGDLSG